MQWLTTSRAYNCSLSTPEFISLHLCLFRYLQLSNDKFTTPDPFYRIEISLKKLSELTQKKTCLVKNMIKSRSVRGRKTLKRASDAQTDSAFDAPPPAGGSYLHQTAVEATTSKTNEQSIPKSNTTGTPCAR